VTETLSRSARQIELTETFAAHNYDPLPVVASHGDGSWVIDVDGRRYLDCLAAYSALNFGHRHPALIEAARTQLDRLTLTSRAFYNDQLGPFCRDLAALAGMECVLPMNTGVEAVETAIKVARRWGYDVKGVPEEQAQIVVMTNNFHGRTTTVISFSNDHIARRGFGPFTPGFVAVPFGDAEAVAGAITPRTVAVLLEPVQGEAGVFVPPPGYVAAVRRICTDSRVLFLADEIQSGLGRCGTTFACEREDVVPDVYMLGKALGGGIVPVSAVLSRNVVLGVITPGQPRVDLRRKSAGGRGRSCSGRPPGDRGVPGTRARLGRAAPGPAGASGRQQGDHRGSHRRAVGRGGPRSGGTVGPAGRRRPRATRRAGEGDPRHHDSIRTAVDHHRGGARLDAGSVRGRARRRDSRPLIQASCE
jgi:acetylornithine/succinyldiaminopimelate/putrescine aminotransferase